MARTVAPPGSPRSFLSGVREIECSNPATPSLLPTSLTAVPEDTAARAAIALCINLSG